jgi:hypothetical protein
MIRSARVSRDITVEAVLCEHSHPFLSQLIFRHLPFVHMAAQPFRIAKLQIGKAGTKDACLAKSSMHMIPEMHSSIEAHEHNKGIAFRSPSSVYFAFRVHISSKSLGCCAVKATPSILQ